MNFRSPRRKQGVARVTALLCAGMLALFGVGCSDVRLEPETQMSDPQVSEELSTTNAAWQGLINRFSESEHSLFVDVLNTGKSDCLILRPDDQVILVDTADTDDCPAIFHRLDSYGIQTIDYLIITHYDNDHIGSIAEIVKHYTVKTVLLPDYVRNSYLYRKMMDALESVKDRTEWIKLKEDYRVTLSYGDMWVNPTHLYGENVVVGDDGENPDIEENNFSLITYLSFGDARLLLTGDAEKDRMEEYNRLLPPGSRCDFLKMPHHGDRYKALNRALEALHPHYCTICVDSMANISPRLVTEMDEVGAEAYYTFNGDILFATDGRQMGLVQAS